MCSTAGLWPADIWGGLQTSPGEFLLTVTNLGPARGLHASVQLRWSGCRALIEAED